MAPTHVPPFIAERVELVEEVIFPLEIDEAIWIVCLVFAWREVHLRTISLLVGARLGAGEQCAKRQGACE
jgi:hypothetical protein